MTTEQYPRSHRALPRRNLLITYRLASRDHILQMSAAQRVGNLFVWFLLPRLCQLPAGQTDAIHAASFLRAALRYDSRLHRVKTLIIFYPVFSLIDIFGVDGGSWLVACLVTCLSAQDELSTVHDGVIVTMSGDVRRNRCQESESTLGASATLSSSKELNNLKINNLLHFHLLYLVFFNKNNVCKLTQKWYWNYFFRIKNYTQIGSIT